MQPQPPGVLGRAAGAPRGTKRRQRGVAAALAVSGHGAPSSSTPRSLSPRAAPQGTRPRAAATAQAPPRPAEPSRHCRVGRGRFAIKRRTGTRFLVLWIFFPHFPSLCFPSGPRSAPGALSRGAPAAMEAAAAGERGRAGRAGERARIPARWAGEVVPPDLRNSFRTTNSSPSGGCPWTHRPALPGGQGDCGAGGFRKSPEDSDNSSLGVLLCPGGPS